MAQDVITPEHVLDDPPLPLAEHLIELRKRIILSLLGLGGSAVLVYPYAGRLLSWMAVPAGGLVFTSPTEAFYTRLKVSFFIGFVMALPLILYHAWAFVARAMRESWRVKIMKMAPLSYFLFLLGSGLAIGVVVPTAMRFLLSYGSDQVKPLITLSAYLDFVTGLCLAFGVVFQLPLVLYGLNRAGIVHKEQLAPRRRYIYLLAFIASGVMTPGPDVFSQFALAVPGLALFELTLLTLA